LAATLAAVTHQAKKKAPNGAGFKEFSPMALKDAKIKAEIERQIGEKASVAPRDIAQALSLPDMDWQKLLPRVRQQSVVLHSEGKLDFLRKKKRVSPEGLKGVYRLCSAEQHEPGGERSGEQSTDTGPDGAEPSEG
jgi:hypothetical protein